MTQNDKNLFFMKAAFQEAYKAYLKKEVPVGAVVVLNNQIIARAHNNRKQKNLFFGHAEFLALIKANKKLKNRRLTNSSVYVTLEPCLMCAGALIQAGVKHVYYGAADSKTGCIKSLLTSFELPLPHKVIAHSGFLAQESSDLLKTFFQQLRKKDGSKKTKNTSILL
ncbi:Cytidine/deoxycytidylate deaminase family protein [Candidatus Phytoplasma australiense]|uniref:tRNA-specific adenosine deaminase n=2 Tax=Phytoplasma australiense TaxID=59748 RepID=B1VAS3_PHYAS|nr:nucleoside deaminase [Candidatus Phytoplasma australiense]AGL90463.1 Cytidine/Deoxycytidylate Deaminase Family Protein [Strawberry lethal yellows phytoplasma (CPA) str. NZSb11]CAM12046.1 Cytidine/deoxycytidylate deaminase family protein [Candidatus Phytoplasma australiense]